MPRPGPISRTASSSVTPEPSTILRMMPGSVRKCCPYLRIAISRDPRVQERGGGGHQEEGREIPRKRQGDAGADGHERRLAEDRGHLIDDEALEERALADTLVHDGHHRDAEERA